MSFLDIFRPKKREFFPDTEQRVHTPLLFPAEKNPTAASCIDRISNTLAKLPLRIYEKTSDGLRLASSHWLAYILQNPSVEETPALFYTELARFLLNTGNVFIYKYRSGEKIVGYSLVDPMKVTVERDPVSHRKRYYIDGRYYTDYEILHIPYIGCGYNGTIGMAPVSQFRELINLDNQLLTYIGNYFENSVGNRIVVNLGQTYPQRKQSLDQLYAEIIPTFNKFVVGAQNAGKPMIGLPDSSISEINQPSNVQAQLKTLMDMVERQIAQTVFNMPFELINSEASKYDSLEAKSADFLASCIEPLGNHICESFEKELSPAERTRYQIVYEYKNLLTTNTKDTVDYLTKEFQSGALTMNEVRKKLGMSSMGEAGDYHFIPSNLMPLTMENIDAYMAKSKIAIDQAHDPKGDDKT